MKTTYFREIEQVNPGLVNPNQNVSVNLGIKAKVPYGDGIRWYLTDADYMHLRNAVLELLSIDLMHYRTQQMERRLVTHLERSGSRNWAEYAQSLYRQPERLQHFVEFLTINVSSFYRDGSKWDQLTQWILPELLNTVSSQGIQAWSIPCSMGAEPYTLAMLLQDLAPNRNHKVYAADIDMTVLERARAGGPYSHNDLREMPQKMIEKHFIPKGNNQFQVSPAVRNLVNFERFDLLQDSTDRLHDLVICRNLVIYFTPAIREQVFQNLVRTLKPGGVLFIGSTETITNHRQYGFDYLAPSFYQRMI